MNSFYYPLLKLNEYEQVRDCLSQKKTCQVTGCSDSQLAHFIMATGRKSSLLLVH